MAVVKAAPKLQLLWAAAALLWLVCWLKAGYEEKKQLEKKSAWHSIIVIEL